MSILLQVMKADKYQPPAVVCGIMAQKLAAAKEWLGERWIGHPNYVFQEKHRIYKGLQ